MGKGREYLTKFKTFLIESKRVWQLTKKPNKNELITVLKVTGLGLLILGVMGSLINIIWQIFLK
ncbi:MAG TPA: protein translocase SEC61 complex subunit gamma [Candidatus Nanoarchaeia archaeon]|nr:protein translocase SEC61 complex subunit gamma [Candidatus Nanoarchaeia archaeon]